MLLSLINLELLKQYELSRMTLQNRRVINTVKVKPMSMRLGCLAPHKTKNQSSTINIFQYNRRFNPKQQNISGKKIKTNSR